MKSQLKKSQKSLKALSHPLSVDILEFLLKNKECKASVIHVALKIEQSVCSMMLSSLKNAKLVTAVKVGREMHYRVNKDSIKVMLDSLKKEICKN